MYTLGISNIKLRDDKFSSPELEKLFKDTRILHNHIASLDSQVMISVIFLLSYINYDNPNILKKSNKFINTFHF